MQKDLAWVAWLCITYAYGHAFTWLPVVKHIVKYNILVNGGWHDRKCILIAFMQLFAYDF